MQKVRRILAAAGSAAVLAASSVGGSSLAFAAETDPPLPMAVKQRLVELTTAPSVRGRCVDAEVLQALVGAAPAYAEEIAVFAARRLQERTPRGDEDCSCLIELATGLGSAMPERSVTLAGVVAQQSPACGGLISRGIGGEQGGGPGIAIDTRTASRGAIARTTCAMARTCATPLLRPHSDLIGPTRLGGDS